MSTAGDDNQDPMVVDQNLGIPDNPHPTSQGAPNPDHQTPVEPNDTDTEEDPGRNNPRFLCTGTLEGQIPYLGHNFHARWMPAGEHATAEESEGESAIVRISPHISRQIYRFGLSTWALIVGATFSRAVVVNPPIAFSGILLIGGTLLYVEAVQVRFHLREGISISLSRPFATFTALLGLFSAGAMVSMVLFSDFSAIIFLALYALIISWVSESF